MSNRRALLSDVLWALLAVAILAGGIVGFRILGALREPVAAVPVVRTVPVVEVAPFEPHEGPVPVAGEGFITPVRKATLASEAPGRIVELSTGLLARGDVRAGEVLARIDNRSARAALTRARSDIDSTRARLNLNATQLARTESLRRRGMVSQDELDRALAQESELTAALASLQSARESAEIALQATRVLAPFDGRVLERSVEVGDVIGAGQTIALVFTPDRLEVTVPLEEAAAALIPGLFEGEKASARVSTRFAGRERVFGARIERVGSSLAARTRTLDVTVALLDPSGGKADENSPPAGAAPALVNAWADVIIDGQAPGTVHAVASSLVREGDTLWLMADERLKIVPIRVLRIEQGINYVTLTEQVPDGAQLVTSLLPAPVDGMPVRLAEPLPDASPVDGATLSFSNP